MFLFDLEKLNLKFRRIMKVDIVDGHIPVYKKGWTVISDRPYNKTVLFVDTIKTSEDILFKNNKITIQHDEENKRVYVTINDNFDKTIEYTYTHYKRSKLHLVDINDEVVYVMLVTKLFKKVKYMNVLTHVIDKYGNEISVEPYRPMMEKFILDDSENIKLLSSHYNTSVEDINYLMFEEDKIKAEKKRLRKIAKAEKLKRKLARQKAQGKFKKKKKSK